MTAALLGLLCAAAPSGYRLDLVATGADAGGVTAGIAMTEQWEMLAAGAAALRGDSAWSVATRVTWPAGPLRLGGRLGVGTALEAGAYGEWKGPSAALHLDAGYQRGGAAILASGALPTIVGTGFVGEARLSASLGPVEPYALLRGGRTLPGQGAALLSSAVRGGGGGGGCTPSGFWNPPSSASPVAETVLWPGAGLTVPFFGFASVFAEALWMPGAGAHFSAGLSMALARPRPVEGPVRPPVAPPRVGPAPVPRGAFAVRLLDDGAPLVGAIALDGARHLELAVGPTGAASVDLEPGRWRVAFRAPGHLARESVVQVADGEIASLTVELRRAPALRRAVAAGDRIALAEPFQFEPGYSDLTAAMLPVLDEIADLAVNAPGRALSVTTHVPPMPAGQKRHAIGQEADPDALTQAQADAIVSYLSQRVDPERLAPVAAGAREPVIPNLTRAARDANRRVVFSLVEGGSPRPRSELAGDPSKQSTR